MNLGEPYSSLREFIYHLVNSVLGRVHELLYSHDFYLKTLDQFLAVSFVVLLEKLNFDRQRKQIESLE